MRHAVLCLAGMTMMMMGLASGQSVFRDSDRGRPDRSYDVLHYRITVSFDEDKKSVQGTASIRFVPLVQKSDSVVFDAAEMDVHSVTLAGGKALRFANRSPVLTLYLDHSYYAGDTLEAAIDYSCTPKKGLYFIQPDSSHPSRHRQIWSQGEDMDNHYWFPCYDFPNEKATSEVTATVREEYTVLSNGRLVKETHDAKRKTRTFHWREEKPHASYLIMVAAGEYTIAKDMYKNLPVTYYVYPEDAARAKLVFGRTPAMLKVFEEKIRFPYPWEKFSQILIDDFMWGGMENTTAVTMNTALLVDERAAKEMSPDPTIAHELAHQWWGDVVTCRDWSHLWLNEGFATYFERIYDESANGETDFQYGMLEMSRWVRMTDRTMGRKPIVSKESYSANVYSRGGWVLHMLRDVLGEVPFWNAIHGYIVRNQFHSVETRDLELAIQDATGQNLDWFFNEWVYGAGYPRLQVEKTWSDSSNVLKLHVKQIQQCDSLTGIFKFPINVECAGSGWSTLQRIWVDRVDSTYLFPLQGRPLMVTIDKGYQVLMELDYDRPKDELLYALIHATDVPERIRIVRELENIIADTDAVQGISRCALQDPFWGVRRAATEALGTLKGDTARAVLISLATNDKDGRVRASAASALSAQAVPEVEALLEHMVDTDSSYLAANAALRSLAKVDSARALDLALKSLGKDSYRDIIRLSSIGTLQQLRSTASIIPLSSCVTPAHSTEVRERAISAIGAVGKTDSTAGTIIARAVNDGDKAVRRSAVQVLIRWGGEKARAVLAQRAPVEPDEDIRAMINHSLNEGESDSQPSEK